MKKYKICKILLVILANFLCVAFYELLGICVAYKKQPEVSNITKKETKKRQRNILLVQHLLGWARYLF